MCLCPEKLHARRGRAEEQSTVSHPMTLIVPSQDKKGKNLLFP